MRLHSRNFFLLCLILPLGALVGFSPLPSSELIGSVEITVERAERVSRDEVHFQLKLTNKGDQPIFLVGVNDESGRRPELIFIEQWRPKDGWNRSYCMDTPPPHVIKLSPGEVIGETLWAKLPMSVICRNRIARWEGKFRFRVEYFNSPKQARTYVNTLFSDHWKDAHAPAAFSEPFEIPVASEPPS